MFGKFLLDSISIGMYNDPLMLFREYIQNSADSIDSFSDDKKNKEKGKIEIMMDGVSRSIIIKDNGMGIKAKDAKRTLQDIGKSNKKAKISRGFRGIGRLGGLGYSDKLVFKTKAIGEQNVSICSWNCKELRKLINDNGKEISAEKVVETVATSHSEKYRGNKKDCFFIVEMLGVESTNDVLLNVPIVRDYIANVAPVPFNSKEFKFAENIEAKLTNKVPLYNTYDISVNGEQVFKGYQNGVKTNKSTIEQIEEINFIDLNFNGESLAYGWIGKLKLQGRIKGAELTEGIRVRSGNIMVGDKDLLAGLFREKRFNSYLVGELHTTSKRLILNARRDDFEDNKAKESFQMCFARTIGIPFSREIRKASQARSQNNAIFQQDSLLKDVDRIEKQGYLSEFHKKTIMKKLIEEKEKNNDEFAGKAQEMVLKMEHARHALDSRKHKIPAKTRTLLSSLFNIIQEKCTNKREAEEIVLASLNEAEKVFEKKRK